MKFTNDSIKKHLLRFDALTEVDGLSAAAAADRLGIKLELILSWKKKEDDLFSIPGPWQLTHNGKTWHDMPGADTISKRCNFSLFRRGLIDLDRLKLPFATKRKRRTGIKKGKESEDDFELTPLGFNW